MSDRSLGEIVIARRFCGPPNSGNGGYVAGRLAAFVEGVAEITLRRPPPLDTALWVGAAEADGIALMQGDTLVASAAPSALALDVPVRPGFAEAEAAARRAVAPEDHQLPMCFVCGPGRAHGDGLRIFTGPLSPEDTDWTGALAAPWVPGADLAGPDGRTAPEFVWSALDCPTGFATVTPGAPETILLGRLAARIERRPRPGEPCIVVAWRTGRQGRKLTADAALLSDDGETLALARATWIQVERTVQLGSAG